MDFLRRYGFSLGLTIVIFTPFFISFFRKNPEEAKRYFNNGKEDTERCIPRGDFTKQYPAMRLRREDLETIVGTLVKPSRDYVIYLDDHRIPTIQHVFSIPKKRTRYFHFVSNAPRYDLVLASDGARLRWNDDNTETALAAFARVDRLLTQRTMALRQIDGRIAYGSLFIGMLATDTTTGVLQSDIFYGAIHHHYLWLYNIVGTLLIAPLIYYGAYFILIDHTRHCIIDLRQRRQSRVAAFFSKNGASMILVLAQTRS